MKNYLKKPQKGKSQQKIKKEYNAVSKIILACALAFILLAVMKIISFRSCFMGWILVIVFSGFYDAYLGIKYRMSGRFGNFPIRTGRPALITGIIMAVVSFTLLIGTLILIYGKF